MLHIFKPFYFKILVFFNPGLQNNLSSSLLFYAHIYSTKMCGIVSIISDCNFQNRFQPNLDSFLSVEKVIYPIHEWPLGFRRPQSKYITNEHKMNVYFHNKRTRKK